MSKKPDLDQFRRVIERGIAEAAKECGMEWIALTIDIVPLPGKPGAAGIAIKVVEATAEEAEAIKKVQASLARIGIHGGSA